MENESDIESATHPPIVGYLDFWTKLGYPDLWTEWVGGPLTNAVGADGPMPPTHQRIEYTVTYGKK